MMPNAGVCSAQVHAKSALASTFLYLVVVCGARDGRGSESRVFFKLDTEMNSFSRHEKNAPFFYT